MSNGYIIDSDRKLKEIALHPLDYKLDRALDPLSIPYLFYKDIGGSEMDQPDLIEERSYKLGGYFPKVFSRVRMRQNGEVVGLIMEKVNGETLDNIFAEESPHNTGILLKNGDNILADIDHVYELFMYGKVSHGDLTEHNIMVDERGRFLLIDPRKKYDRDIECQLLRQIRSKIRRKITEARSQ